MDKRVIKEGNVIKNISYENFKSETDEGESTLLQLFQNKAKLSPNHPFLGTILKETPVYETFSEISQKVIKLAGFLESITVPNSLIGLFSVNRTEWSVGEFASYAAGCINCPLYASFSKESLVKIIEETDMEVIIISGECCKLLWDYIISEGKKYNIKKLILMDHIDLKIETGFKEKNIECFYINNIFQSKPVPITRPEPKADDIATICYTSGTSGIPKGVILTHKNIISVVAEFSRNKNPKDIIIVDDKIVYISYLPLSHVLERICFYAVLSKCGKICFFRGRPKDVQKDFEAIQPRFFVAVPRVLNIFKSRIESVFAEKNIFVRGLFKLGLKWKTLLRRFGIHKSFLFDNLIFKKVASKFGGKLEYCLCGGAAVDPEVVKFIEAVFSCKIFLGYGQTEGMGANILQPLDCYDLETVGIPFITTMIKLETRPDYPEGQGEILLKGPSITPGYFKRDEETRKAFTQDGWLKTGDLAMEKNGYIYILGRIKEVFKTSFGEYIVPEKIEVQLVGGNIEDIYITTSQFSDFLVAIVVSEKKEVTKELVLKEIKERGETLISEKKMNRYEIPAQVILIREPFNTYDNGNLVTPTMKKRRMYINEYFKDEIENAYFNIK